MSVCNSVTVIGFDNGQLKCKAQYISKIENYCLLCTRSTGAVHFSGVVSVRVFHLHNCLLDVSEI
jgi:hypothetical protein